MPGLVGGFGKIYINTNTIKRYLSLNKELNLQFHFKEEEEIELKLKIGPYLAGLIESDGTIAVHNKDSNTKIYNPKIAVVFNLVDEPLAKKLAIYSKFHQIKFPSERRSYSTSSAGYVYSELGTNMNSIMFNSYLAGLIESSGTFAIHDVNSKSKSYSPKLLILFKLNDYFLVDKLISITGIGVLDKQKSSIL